MWKLSKMKGSFELLSTAMRTINFEAMFVNYVQFWINFHSFRLRLSLDTDLIHISIKKVLFDRQKTLSPILESTIAFVRFRYKAFLKFCLS